MSNYSELYKQMCEHFLKFFSVFIDSFSPKLKSVAKLKQALQVINKAVKNFINPVYTIEQTSSNHRANIQQMHAKYTCTTCALIARCLLDDCLIV